MPTTSKKKHNKKLDKNKHQTQIQIQKVCILIKYLNFRLRI